ncbi:uncharacterized protein ACBT57_020069 [Dama dama]
MATVSCWGSHVTCWVNCTSTLHNETCEWWNTNRSFHVLEPHPENSGSSAQRRRTSPHSRGSLSPKEQQVHCDCSGSWPRNLTTREEEEHECHGNARDTGSTLLVVVVPHLPRDAAVEWHVIVVADGPSRGKHFV